MRQHDPKKLQKRVESALGHEMIIHDISFRPMFGGITGYTRGRNFLSLSNVGIALKLDANQRAALFTLPGARPLQYEPAGPLSRSSVVFPDDLIADDVQLREWLLKSITYCQSLSVSTSRRR